MKSFIILAIIAVVVGCSNKEKTQQQKPPETVEETPPEIDEVHEQELSDLMLQVGNVHKPFPAEIYSHGWCAVEDESFTPSQTETIQFSSSSGSGSGAYVMNDVRGYWSLQGDQLTLRNGIGSTRVEQVAVASVARGPEVILLKLTMANKPSLLYRDCSL